MDQNFERCINNNKSRTMAILFGRAHYYLHSVMSYNIDTYFKSFPLKKRAMDFTIGVGRTKYNRDHYVGNV